MTSNRDDDAPGRSRLRWLTGGLVLLGIPLVVIWWPGCRQYPTASSIESYELMEALYTACNTRNPDWLARAEKRVDHAIQEDKLSLAEQEAFRQIIRWAKTGDWERAEKAAYQFADDQRGRGVTTGGSHDHGKKTKAKGK